MIKTYDTPNFFRRPAEPMFGVAIRPKLVQVGRSIWRAAEAYGRARAQREMARLAEHYATTRPELAKALRAASE